MSVSIGERSAVGDAVGGEARTANYRRVVVGVDGSPGSRAALLRALAVAAGQHTEVEVITSYAVPLFWSGDYPVAPPAPSTLRSDTEARMEAFIDDVRRSPSAVRIPGSDTVPLRLVVSAHPAVEALLDRAGETDLLVVGSRGRGARRKALLGSVALDCVTQAVGTVLVVHAQLRPAEAPPRVVVGVDGSAHSRAALVAGIAEAVRLRAHVEVVHAYELTDYWVDAYPGDMPDADVLGDQARRRADDLVREVVRGTSGEPELQLRTVVTKGAVADVLLERADGASLLVVGRRGHGPLPRAVPGSVALLAALHAGCPVLLVPLPDGPAARVDHGAARTEFVR